LFKLQHCNYDSVKLMTDNERREPLITTENADARSNALGSKVSVATENLPLVEQDLWKPARNISYETMVLANTELNKKIRPAGYRSDGKFRQIKGTCLLSKIRTRCRVRNMNPRMTVCITMYNEDENELKQTLEGVLHNYNCLKLDPTTAFSKDDFTIVLICDGYDKITESFKEFARQRHFLDE
jgi:hypothetical protein